MKTEAIACAAVFSLVAAACTGSAPTAGDSEERKDESSPQITSSLDSKERSMTSTAEPALSPPQTEAPAPGPKPADTPRAPADESEAETKTWPEGFEERMSAAAERAERGDDEEALALYSAASELRPGHAMPYIEQARILVDQGFHDEAREHAARGVEIFPSSSRAWNTLGRVELGAGDLEAAAEAFRRAAEQNEDNSYAWNNLGLAYLELARYGDAADALEVATSGLEPEAYMWNNLGMAYEHLDEPDKARAAYRQGMQLGSAKAETNLDRLELAAEADAPGDEEGDLEAPSAAEAGA